MPDDDLEQFQHFHGDGLKNLELEKYRLQKERSEVNLLAFDDALQSTLDNIQAKLTDKAAQGPEAVFKETLHSLNEIEAKRFIILNVLEALKKGDKIGDIIRRYGGLGLIPAKDATGPENTTPLQATRALLARKSIWERVTTAVAQLAINALKSVPKWVEIEPHFGFVGPMPMLSFSLKGKGMNVQELIEILLKSREAPSTAQ